MNKKIIRILVIEDEPLFIEIIKELLKVDNLYNAEFIMNTATRISTAIELLEVEYYDAILLDLNLPDSNDKETYNKINNLNLKTPIIILTNINNNELISSCLQAGAQDYLLKKELNGYILIKSIINSIARYNLYRNLIFSKKELESFAYNVAHDIKKPISSVISTLRLIEEFYTKEEQLNIQYLNDAKYKLFNIAEIIDTILDYSIVDKSNIHFKKINLNYVMEKAISNLKSDIKENNVSINKIDLPEINGDETQLVILFQNLIDNAIKYGKKDNKVFISIKKEQKYNKWFITVEDNGFGIEEEYLESIFLPFYRLEKIKSKGYGIGLSTCKKILDNHFGDIKAYSKINEGTSITFTMPTIKD